MNAGRLIEAVALDSPVQLSDGQGGTETGWSEQHACRARFTWLRGGETVMAGRLQGKQPVVIRVRACAATDAVTTDWRVRDTRRGSVFNIRSIIPSDDRAFLDMTCETGVAV